MRQLRQTVWYYLEGVNSLHSKLPIFRDKSVKIYTGQFFFTQAPPVVPVTNMRYGHSLTVSHSTLNFMIQISQFVRISQLNH